MFIFEKPGGKHPHSLGVKLAKFMLSLRDESFELLQTEAEDRGISIQELIRAVIIPDWVKVNTVAKPAFDNASNGFEHTDPLLQRVTKNKCFNLP